MPQYMFDLSVDRVDLVNEGACSEAHIMLFKNKKGDNKMTYEQIMEKLTPEHRATVEATVAKAKEDAEATVAEAVAKTAEMTEELEATKAKCDELEKSLEETVEVEDEIEKSKTDAVEDVIKSLDPAVQAVFKSLQAKTEAAEAVVKAVQKEKEHAEAIAKAKTLSTLPVAEEVLVAEIEKGISPEVMNILEAAAKATADAEIFKSVGTDKIAPTGVDAWARIESAAVEIAKTKNISQAKAIDAAIKENPDLYREYIKNGAN